MALPHLKILTVFSSFLIVIIGTVSKIRATTVENDHTFGEQFVKRIVHGEKLSEKPGYFLFTAPYRLCDGGCNDTDNNNFAMVFPLYVGRKGKEKYKKLYKRDFHEIHSKEPSAPFKKRTTRYPYTLWATSTPTTTETTTTTTTPESDTVTTTETTPITPKPSIIPLTIKRLNTSQCSTILTTVKLPITSEPYSFPTTMNSGINPKNIIIIISVIPHTSSVTNIIPTTAKPISDTETETTINYDIELPTNSDVQIENTLSHDIEAPIEEETQTRSIEQLSKYTLGKKETSTIYESGYNNNIDDDYEPVTTPQRSLEDFITNAKGVRCPTQSSTKCKKHKPTHVTSEIITFKEDSEAYKNEKDSGSLDYYSSINEDDLKALHKLYFDRQW